MILSTEDILGFPITNQSDEICYNELISWIKEESTGKYVGCANPHSLVTSFDDPLFRQALLKADMLLPDGVGIVWASRLLGGSIQKRITGSDLFFKMSKKLNDQGGGRYFFLGSTQKVLDKIQLKMAKDFPNISIVGVLSPPFKEHFNPEENQKMVEIINASQANVLWVGMTAPKQEKWIFEHREVLKTKIIGGIGAVFDFYTGNRKRSHPLFQKVGLEWLPRLIMEPHRLWRRNFVSTPLYILRVLRQWYSQQ